MGLIIDRNDYITKEEYQKLLEKWDDILNLVENIHHNTLRYRGYGEVYSSKYSYMFDKYEDFCSIKLFIHNDDIYEINIKNEILMEIELNIDEVSYSSMRIVGKAVWKLFELLKDYEKLKYDIEHYKNKIVDVVNFNEKEYFKDVYELINNIN